MRSLLTRPGMRRPPSSAEVVRPPAARGLAPGPAPRAPQPSLAAAERFGHRFEHLLPGPAPAGPVPLHPPIQALYGVVAGGGELLSLKKRGKKGFYKDDDGNVYELVPGSTLPHPTNRKSKKAYQEVRLVPPKPRKVKAKEKLEEGYDSGGDSGSESELDDKGYGDFASEDENEWDVEDKGPGRERFLADAVGAESEHFGVSSPPVDTSHHALARQVQTGLAAGSNDPAISLANVSTTNYVRSLVKASTDLPPARWGGTEQHPRQTFGIGDVEVSQQRIPTVNQALNLKIASFGHYGIPKGGETGIYPSETVFADFQRGAGIATKEALAGRIVDFTATGRPFQTTELGAGSSAEKTAQTRRINALVHLAGHEEILRAIHQSSVASRKPAGTALALGIELLQKDPKFTIRHLFGRSAKYGPVTPEKVAANPKRFERRFYNAVKRYGKLKLRRSAPLRRKVEAKGKNPKDVGKTFTLVPKKAWIARRLARTYGAK